MRTGIVIVGLLCLATATAQLPEDEPVEFDPVVVTPEDDPLFNAEKRLRELIADRARMTHRRRKAAGHRAGQAPILSDELRHRIADTRTGGASFARIADELNAEGIPTAKGGRWHASTVRHVCMSVEREAELEGIAA